MASSLQSMEPCPKCHIKGRRPVLARYSDGHAYCFWCGYYEHSHLRHKLMKKESPPDAVTDYRGIPLDASAVGIPAKAKQWLYSYGITPEEIANNHIKYSESKDWLIFPIYGNNRSLIAWQARDFSDNPKSKWYSQGKLDALYHVINGTNQHVGKGLAIVEDIISAIKVGRHVPTMCAFGSHLSQSKLNTIHLLFTDRIYVWLDRDKIKDAMKFCQASKQIGMTATCIFSDRDPKEHSDEEIVELLGVN